MSSTEDELIDPFEEHMRRDPFHGKGVGVLVLAGPDRAAAGSTAERLLALIAERGREAGSCVVEVTSDGLGTAIESGLSRIDQPIVIVTGGGTFWDGETLDGFLAAINACDHVVGKRPRGLTGSLGRWVGSIPWRWVFGAPVSDVHSPYTMHRTEKLRAIPLQSRSAFVSIEILAKATFLGHLVDMVDVPEHPRLGGRVAWSDVALVFKRPTFKRRPEPNEGSGPAEDPEGEQEGHDSPHAENGHGRGDLEPARAAEDDGAQGVQ